MQPREVRLLDAAIDVLATGGMRRLTHRAVDTQAGLPVGSTSNLFRSRAALLAGVLRRILERENAVMAELEVGTPSDVAGFSQALGQLVELMADEHRELTLARQAVFVEASGLASVQAENLRARQELAAWAAPVLTRLGSRDPNTDLDSVLALVDGLLLHRIANPGPSREPAPVIAALLRGLLAEMP